MLFWPFKEDQKIIGSGPAGHLLVAPSLDSVPSAALSRTKVQDLDLSEILKSQVVRNSTQKVYQPAATTKEGSG